MVEENRSEARLVVEITSVAKGKRWTFLLYPFPRLHFAVYCVAYFDSRSIALNEIIRVQVLGQLPRLPIDCAGGEITGLCSGDRCIIPVCCRTMAVCICQLFHEISTVVGRAIDLQQHRWLYS